MIGYEHPLPSPVHPLLVWGSLFAALLLDLMPLGRLPWMPDFLAIALVFWALYQPRRVGLLAAFLLGLVLDVHQSTLLGQNALVYAGLVYLVIWWQRRLLRASPADQAVQLLPLFAVAQAGTVLLRLLAGGVFPGWEVALAPILQMLLWPLACALLLNRRARAWARELDRSI